MYDSFTGDIAPKRERLFMANSWSQLSIDVLDNIIRRLEPVDVVSFTGVCKLWRYVAMGMHMSLSCKIPMYHAVPKRSPIPMLLHPGCKGSDTHCLYSLNERKIYGEFHLQELSNKWIVGSRAGWLVIVDTADLKIALLNPLTGKKIHLPHLSTIPRCVLRHNYDNPTAYWYLRKAIVCSYQDSFLVVALVSEFKTIRFCKVGDSEWSRPKNSPIYVDDIIMHNEKLYVVSESGTLFEIDIPNSSKMTMVAPWADVFSDSGRCFLVNLCGELVLLQRLLLMFVNKRASRVTSGFRVFRLDRGGYHGKHETETGIWHRERAGYSWVPLKSLGHHVVFIGYNRSISVDSRIYSRCKGNCIYFADYRRDEYDHLRMRGVREELYHDVGVFRMAEQEVEHFERFSKASSRMNMVWLSPKFCFS